jgi:glyoxylase-like metal-dependent hydrolase (beta-lactamase superfamily II)
MPLSLAELLRDIRQRGGSKVEVRATRVSGSFYVLEGQGGTISVLTGPKGVLTVDSQFAPLTDKIIAAIRQVSDQPIRFLINTHVHADHTGGNENFARIGTLICYRSVGFPFVDTFRSHVVGASGHHRVPAVVAKSVLRMS